MIPLNELRVGNFISDDDGILAKVVGFEPFENMDRRDGEEDRCLVIDFYNNGELKGVGCYMRLRSTSPIPLTPEWLERCGFDPAGEGENANILWRHPSAQIRFDGNQCSYYHDGCYISLPNTKYLHQLQNLYLDLMGSELYISQSTFASGQK